MLGKLKGSIGTLKDKAEGPILQGAVNKLAPQLSPYVEKLKTMEPAVVFDDEQFVRSFISPTAMTLMAASGGVTSLIPGFNDRFTRGMLHVRNELLAIDEENNSVLLQDDFTARLPGVLLEGIKLPV